MAHTLVSCTFQPTNGLSQDQVVNTFVFRHDAVLSSGLATSIFDAVEGFYNTVAPVLGNRLSSFLSDNLSRNANDMALKAYDLTGREGINPATGKVYAHGSPLYESARTLGAAVANSNPLPAQVAIVMTTRGFAWDAQPIERADGADADAKIDRPRQRYSGRVFLGPWNTTVLAEDSNEARPQAGTINLIGEMAGWLQDQVNIANAHWGVWSRKDGAVRDITDVQVDNAFDIQRRRQARPTARTTFSV